MLKRLLFVLLLLPVSSFAESFVAGKDYEILPLVQQTDTAGGQKISVTEFFSFGCPWCFRIDASLAQWVKHHESQIEFQRTPVVFNKEWIYYAKAFYAADLLGIGSKLNPLLFKAIQTDKLKLASNQAMIDFFMAQGVDKAMAESAFTHSTAVDMNVNEANVMMGRYHINAVPAIVIDNRYKTDLQMAQGEDRLFKVIDFLLTKSRQKKPA